MARRGGALLPPYETRATLARLDTDLDQTGARSVICLGDSFDDLQAAETSNRVLSQSWVVGLHRNITATRINLYVIGSCTRCA